MIQNVTMVTLPAGPERGPVLRTQLEQIAWAGELEGWLTGPLKVHLLAAPSDSGFWESVFKDWGESCEIVPPKSPKELAALSARRCGSGAANTSLLPPEFASRYRQQFVDRLWMRGLVSVLGLYILGVLFYFGMLYVFVLKSDAVKRDLANMGPSYTNACRDVEQIRILRERESLKYAALDCWKAVAENLPDSMTVDDMDFVHGKLELRGSFIPENLEEVGTFNEALRIATDPNHHELLFADVTPQHTRTTTGKGDWDFSCALKGTDNQ